MRIDLEVTVKQALQATRTGEELTLTHHGSGTQRATGRPKETRARLNAELALGSGVQAREVR